MGDVQSAKTPCMPAGGEALMTDDQPGAALLRLVAVMDTLRTSCPWDARQTHESLAPYLLEETYEALEALEHGDRAELRGELGDVLLQVLFHARIASERDDETGFTIDDVANGIAAKLVRRHPHVFADVTVSGADEVRQNWVAIKARERWSAGGGPGSALDGVPMGQPALSLAAQLQRRAQAAGAPAALAGLLPRAPAEPVGHFTTGQAGRERSGAKQRNHQRRLADRNAALAGQVEGQEGDDKTAQAVDQRPQPQQPIGRRQIGGQPARHQAGHPLVHAFELPLRVLGITIAPAMQPFAWQTMCGQLISEQMFMSGLYRNQRQLNSLLIKNYPRVIFELPLGSVTI